MICVDSQTSLSINIAYDQSNDLNLQRTIVIGVTWLEKMPGWHQITFGVRRAT